MTSLPPTLAEIARRVENLLAARGPMTREDLVAALEDSMELGVPADDVLAEVEDSDLLPGVLYLSDDRLVHLPALLEGRTFTRRVTEAEVERDLLAADPDLACLTWLVAAHPTSLQDGRPVTAAFTAFDPEAFEARGVDPSTLPVGEHVLLPPGLMQELAVAAGDLVGVTSTARGWEVTKVDQDDLTPLSVQVADVEAWLEEQHAPTEVVMLLWWLVDEHDQGRRPGPPVTELLDTWGVVRHGDYVAPAGFDIDAWATERQVAGVRSSYRLGQDDAAAVVLLHRRHSQLATVLASLVADDVPAAAAESGKAAQDADGVAGAVERLARPQVAEALVDLVLGVGSTGAAALGLLAESLEGVATEAARPALGWLLAMAHERSGDAVAAEVTLQDVVGGSDFPPALRSLARYASDRGRAAESAALLRRAGVARSDPELTMLERMASSSARDLGRNQPCWCGSGRKYKVCHLGKEDLPLAERAAWLYHKGVRHLLDGSWTDVLRKVALERTRWDGRSAVHALEDPLVMDTVLHEGGVFADFLRVRGDLLPADERLMGEQWVLGDRALLEVQAVRPRRSLTLRDLRTADVTTVRESSATSAVGVGDLLCGRIVPAGDTFQLMGGLVPVRMAERDALLDLLDADPEPAEVVALLCRRFAPPTLQNSEGEDLVLHRALLRPRDLAAVVGRLDEALVVEGASDAGAPGRAWSDAAEVDGRETIRATVRLDDDGLILEANSDRRFDRIMLLVHEADPDVETVEHERRTADEMAELAERFPALTGAPVGDALPDSPEVAAMLEQVVLQLEERWLDEEVPALAGLTPRQATDDPTRRDDVVRLLRSFPPATPGAMSRDRLAAALGLSL